MGEVIDKEVSLIENREVDPHKYGPTFDNGVKTIEWAMSLNK